ncbi:hypothetical protein AAG594_14450 [Citromicrobium bathyomarinum]
MSDSNWRGLYTAILITAATGALVFGGWLWRSTDTQHFRIEQEASKAAETYSDPRYIAQQGECLEIPPDERSECVTEEREATYEGQRNERDLQAQRQMAVWTRTIGIATIVGMAFGIFGLSLIFVTFRETRRAADAGFRANEIAQESSERQLRAYFGLDGVWLQLPPDSVNLGVRFKNFGQTPALGVTLTGTVSVMQTETKEFHRQVGPLLAPVDLPPSQVMTRTFSLPAEARSQISELVRNGTARLRARIILEYSDIFDKRYRVVYFVRGDQGSFAKGQLGLQGQSEEEKI